MIFFLKILYALTSISLILYLINLYKREGLNCSLVVLGFFSLYYIFVPTLLIFFESQLSSQGLRRLILIDNNLDSRGLITWFYTIIALFVIGIASKVRFRFGRHGREQEYNYYESNEDRSLSIYEISKVRKVGYFFLVVGGLSLIILIYQLGGISKALSLGSLIRAYSTSNEDYLSATGSMFKTLSAIILGSGYCFLVCYYSSKRKEDKVLLVISIILSLLYIFFNSGRSELVFFLLIYIFGYLMMKGKNLLKVAIVLGVIVILGSEILGTIMDLISTGSFNINTVSKDYDIWENIMSTLSDFSYPYCNLLNIDNIIHKFGYRYFTDYFTWIFSLLPSRLLGINMSGYKSATVNISNYYLGILSGFKGGTPVDLITYGIIQFPILGMVINSFLYGALIRNVFEIKAKIGRYYGPMLWFLYIFCFDLMLSSDLLVIIKSKLAQIIVLILLLHISKNIREYD